MLRLMQILWPSFLMAALGTGLLFSMVDPDELIVFGFSLAGQRMAAYTCGFFMLWALGALAAGTTLWLSQSKPGSPPRR